jgi:RNA recognition motif-containing protein
MNSLIVKNLLATLVLAVVLYLLLQFLEMNVSGALGAAIGVVLGGLLTTLLALCPTANGQPSAADSGEPSTLYVGNLPYKANEQAVQDHFEGQGSVKSVRLMKDRRTGKRKGYGFVEMDAKGAQKAIKNLNDSVFMERTLKVRLAKDKVEEDE